jgi:hypothetical protein
MSSAFRLYTSCSLWYTVANSIHTSPLALEQTFSYTRFYVSHRLSYVAQCEKCSEEHYGKNKSDH